MSISLNKYTGFTLTAYSYDGDWAGCQNTFFFLFFVKKVSIQEQKTHLSSLFESTDRFNSHNDRMLTIFLMNLILLGTMFL